MHHRLSSLEMSKPSRPFHQSIIFQKAPLSPRSCILFCVTPKRTNKDLTSEKKGPVLLKGRHQFKRKNKKPTLLETSSTQILAGSHRKKWKQIVFETIHFQVLRTLHLGPPPHNLKKLLPCDFQPLAFHEKDPSQLKSAAP